MNSELLDKLSECIEFGKINLASPYPPPMKGLPVADEITKEALESGVEPNDILNIALITAMNKVGQKFSENKIFVPQMLLSAKAMSTSMMHLKPYFASGAVNTGVLGCKYGTIPIKAKRHQFRLA
ncbi:MAG: B12-binding domain-containing protein [Paludibacter sp.]|nr:B12-binding domain-containing protein [Paludibacter sp.]